MLLGIHCPRCDGTVSRTLDTRKKGNTIRRKRECHHCGAWFWTEERSAVARVETIAEGKQR